MKLLSALALAASVSALPNIPSDYSAAQKNDLVINQGGIPGPDGDVCCSLKSNCKVQVEANQGNFYNSYKLQKTKFDIPGAGYIISDFSSKEKRQYTVQTQGEGKCTYCPTEGNVTKDFVPATAKDKGAVTVEGKTLEHWQWQDLFIIIQMELIDTYVDQSVSPNYPTQQNVTITPFGQYLGTENTQFSNWKAGLQNASIFDLPSGCTYAGDKNCNQDSAERLAKYKLTSTFKVKAEDEPTKPRVAHLKAGKATPAPVFPGDWTASEENFVLEQQGGIKGDGIECCYIPSECKIQTEYDAAKHYYSVKHNAERFDDHTQGATIVYDYTLGKGIQANMTGGVLTCQNYCPIQTTTLTPFGVPDGAVYTGMQPYQGKSYQTWTHNQTGPFNITMEMDTLYVDASGSSPMPVYYLADIEPFGIHLAQQSQTWTNFAAADLPASTFKVAGLDSCPEASNCGQQFWERR